MFWNIEKKPKNHWFSLANKLTLLSTLSAVIIMLGFCFYIYPSFKMMAEQVGRAHVLQQTLQQKQLVSSLGEIAAPFDSELAFVCIKKVITAMFAFIVFSLLVSYLIAERTMRKVKSLALTMQNIDSNELNRRLDPLMWPMELRDVVIPFNHMLDRLESSFTNLSQFSSDIAHELRTPLHNLRSLTEVTLSKERSLPEYQIRLQEFGDEIQQLSRLTESLLFLARVENNQQSLQLKPYSLLKMTHKLLEFFSASIDEKKLEIICTGDATVLVDSLLFERVLSNLLSNAIRHTPSGGTIQFRIHDRCDQKVQFDIQDSGEGILEANLPHIFQRFYRVDYARSQNMGGNGLGLAISHAIVSLQKGHLSVNSVPTQGSCFTILLPR